MSTGKRLEPLGGIVGQQQRAEERDERADVGMMHARRAMNRRRWRNRSPSRRASRRGWWPGPRPPRSGWPNPRRCGSTRAMRERISAFETERLDDARAEHRLGHRLHDLGRPFVGTPGEFAHPPEDPADEIAQRRQGAQGDDGDHGIALDHHRRHPDRPSACRAPRPAPPFAARRARRWRRSTGGR